MSGEKTLLPPVVLKRTFAAPRTKVFDAWTREEALLAWFTSPEYPIDSVEADVRPGGRYVLRWRRQADGALVYVEGVYREVRKPERLVFTWKSSHEPEMSETVVTVDLREEGGSTELTLRHEGFDAAKLRKEHDEGWKQMADSLGRFLG